MKKILLAATAALAISACGQKDEAPLAPGPETSAPAAEAGIVGPPRWVVRDEDSTMVLFGTIHILPEGLEWQSEELKGDIASADEVWFEVLPAELMDQQKAAVLSNQYGASPDVTLSERLDEETYAQLSDVAAELNLPIAQLENFRPWLVAVTVQVVDLVRDGYAPGSGAEMVIAAQTEDSRERALETMEQQLGFFGELPDEVEIAFLKSVLEEVERGQTEIKEFTEDWARGDISALEDLLIGSIQDVSEELYQVLLVRRNEAWAERLSQELEGSGTDFVAVGAGHLVGDDGLPMLLKKRGYTVEGPLPN